jgi:hypothetical protein
MNEPQPTFRIKVDLRNLSDRQMKIIDNMANRIALLFIQMVDEAPDGPAAAELLKLTPHALAVATLCADKGSQNIEKIVEVL